MNSDRLLTENRISLTQLAQSQNVAVPTCWRWATRGIKGHLLETFSVGAKRFTTREAFERWIARINGEPVQSRSARARQGEHAAALAELAKDGV